jgi:Ca2+-binding EF-hand superfamily protein
MSKKKADNIQTAILLFSKYDTDGNGSISKEELTAMLMQKCEDEGISVDLSVVSRQVNLCSLRSLINIFLR